LDGGNTWVQRNDGLSNLIILSLGKLGNNILAGTREGMFISDNDGLNWVAENTPLDASPVTFFNASNSSVFSGSTIHGLILYEIYQNSWRKLNEGLTDSSVNAEIISKSFAFAGTSDHGVWHRPLEQIFSLHVSPDTLFLSQFSGWSDTLFIPTSIAWSIIGSAPDWLSFGPSSGNGYGKVVFRTLKPNLSAFKRYATFFLYSQYASSITFTIAQKEKTSGTEELDPAFIRIYPNPSTGIIHIKSQRPIATITISNTSGKVLKNLNVNGSEMALDFSEGKGVYFLRLEGENWDVTRKLVIL
jgi:hypothetical protein